MFTGFRPVKMSISFAWRRSMAGKFGVPGFGVSAIYAPPSREGERTLHSLSFRSPGVSSPAVANGTAHSLSARPVLADRSRLAYQQGRRSTLRVSGLLMKEEHC